MENNRRVFITGSTIDLCVLDKARHLDKALTWFNAQEVVRYTLQGRFPLSRTDEEKWFESRAADRANLVLAIETKDGEYVGNVGLHRIDWQSRRAELGIIIGEIKKWNNGIGSEAEKLMIGHAFKTLNLHRVWAWIYGDNIGSRKAAAKAGLREEGCLKEHEYRGGCYHDIIVVGTTKQ